MKSKMELKIMHFSYLHQQQSNPAKHCCPDVRKDGSAHPADVSSSSYWDVTGLLGS